MDLFIFLNTHIKIAIGRIESDGFYALIGRCTDIDIGQIPLLFDVSGSELNLVDIIVLISNIDISFTSIRTKGEAFHVYFMIYGYTVNF